MPKIQVATENDNAVELHYEDHGTGKPIVLIHGFPLSGEAWEKQIPVLLRAGRRVIAYDRRGFGKSCHPVTGYDYNTFAADLNELLIQLNLNEVTLVGHSMGTGEVTRYLAKYGSARIEKAVFISPLQPFLLKTSDNPDGLEKKVFDGFQQKIREDRYAFLTQFFTDFYNRHVLDKLKGHQISDEAFQNSCHIGAQASPIATHECVSTWITDFREDVKKINVPSLIIQGTADKILPFEITGKKLHGQIAGSELFPVDGAPHGLLWTHAEEINSELLRFLGKTSAGKQSVA